MNQITPKPRSHLTSAYNQMMQSIQNAFDASDSAEMSLQKALEMARQQAVHLGELTIEEAHEISEFVKRDINDAAEYMLETSTEFGDWLMLDIEVLERKVIDMFLSVADRTRIELEAWQQSNRDLNLYYSGDISGPGILQCTHCGKSIPLLTTAHVESCKACGNYTFQRVEKNKDCKQQ